MVIYYSSGNLTCYTTCTWKSIQIIQLLYKTNKHMIARWAKLHKYSRLIRLNPGINSRCTFNCRCLYPTWLV
ncbi:hypothetical protein ES703_66582 [subsurface metagenome]